MRADFSAATPRNWPTFGPQERPFRCLTWPAVLPIDEPRQPIAFISHSECDDAFCHELYEALCDEGVRPIMDKRDFQPGDDLVRRVFDKGIGISDAVIFVLSPESVDRPWVRKEISVGAVQELQRRTRLIPLLIKGLPDERVPAPLAATYWIRVTDDDSMRSVAKKIAGAMFSDAGLNPTVAPPPAWTRRAVNGKLGLDRRDEVLLAFACRRRLESAFPRVDVYEIVAFAETEGMTEDDVRTAIAMLIAKHFIDQPAARGGLLPSSIQLRSYALELYARVYEPERYASAWRQTVAAIANDRASDMPTLAGIVDEPSVALLELIVEKLHARGALSSLIKPLGPMKWKASPAIERFLNDYTS
jgi:hypothetical protein